MSLQIVDLNKIQPYSQKPIQEIPKYLFENCNQNTTNEYSQAVLRALKELAASMTLEKASKVCENFSDRVVFRKKEEWDWIYGLLQLEKDILKQGNPIKALKAALTAQKVIQYNGCFIRLSMPEQAGKFRSQNIHWNRRDLTPLELLTSRYLQEQLAEGKRHCTKDELKQFLRDRKNDRLPEGWSPQQLKDYIKGRDGLNPDAVEAYFKKGSRLDAWEWLNEHHYFYPLPESISPKLQETLDFYKNVSNMHPIEKAARLWSEIVAIHISDGANKRTAFAIASIFLLAHGYLPPKLKKEEADAYTNLLLDSFSATKADPTPLIKFINFVAEKVMEAQSSTLYNF